MADWDAARYHRLSDPQLGWGRRVLERLAPEPGERILDLGCGTGRLTSEIAAATPVLIVGLDRSAAMLSEARAANARGRRSPMYVRGSGEALPFVGAFDAVFSAATFHWIVDHDRLFAGIHDALTPGGRLVAQCGGGPNLQRLLDRTHALMGQPEYDRYFRGWSDPWTFAYPGETRERLDRAGFTEICTWLEESPTTMTDAAAFAEFISCVCVRHHVDELPPAPREEFVAALAKLAAGDEPPFTLDYWRLNISARKRQ
jgi:trans-aconitate 2-methyltransferase